MEEGPEPSQSDSTVLFCPPLAFCSVASLSSDLYAQMPPTILMSTEALAFILVFSVVFLSCRLITVAEI